MEQTKQPSFSKTLLIAGVILVGIGILTTVAWIQSEKAIKTQAIDGCLKFVTVEIDANGQKIRVPDGYWYSYCMTQKGYDVSLTEQK